jgi:tetratricopeptide (TPR) repeat protein
MDFPGGRYGLTSLVPVLIEEKDWGRAERILLASLKTASPLRFSQIPNGDLVSLAGIYYRAGRPADVRRLLDEAASWGTDDVAGLLTMFDAKYLSFGAIAGSALIATGERERGIAVLRATLRLQPVDDAAARALVDAEGDTAIPLLTALAKVDPFEERPLIWIAYAHLKAGRLNEAEATIRKAISIDPSDGEQPHGHRMAAYGVLADILKARGKTDEERTMRGVVAAIRLAEQADNEAELGLYSRSTKTYRRSLNLFSDAYCIQSRLAVQLADQGRFEEAETHYRRAYELMPDSFGRIESHCFGCEGAFTGERVQRIAENVFMRLVREQPTKPQVHYLLGYLRSAQENPSAALPHYRHAVILDPDYLNAWKSLRELASRTPGAEADLKRADAALARLDPLNRHTQAASSSLRDRYNRGLAALRSLPSLPNHLYPLPKSSRPADDDSPFGMGTMGFAARGYYASPDLPRDPSELLAKDQILVAVMGFNSMLGMARP